MKRSINKWIKKTGMPLIITDDELCFLIDTGASHNVLLESAYHSFVRKFHPTGQKDFIVGIDGNPREVDIVNGIIILEHQKMPCTFAVVDTNEAMDSIASLGGLQIHGALGVDFLVRYRFLIDFATRELRTVARRPLPH